MHVAKHINVQSVNLQLTALSPTAVARPYMEPHTGDGVDSVAKYSTAVFLKTGVSLRVAINLFSEVFFVVLGRDEAIGHEVGVLGNGTDIVPRVVVAHTPWVEIFTTYDLLCRPHC